MENNKQLFVCSEIVSLGAISVGAVFSMTRLQAQFSVKYCSQRPFVENMTALIKMWRFLEGILSPSAEKKGQAEGGTLYGSRCDNFLEDVSLSSTQKKGCRSCCFIRGKTLAHRLALMAN